MQSFVYSNKLLTCSLLDSRKKSAHADASVASSPEDGASCGHRSEKAKKSMRQRARASAINH